MRKGLILGGIGSLVFVIAVDVCFQVAAQASLFWGLVVGALVVLFGLMAFVSVFGKV